MQGGGQHQEESRECGGAAARGSKEAVARGRGGAAARGCGGAAGHPQEDEEAKLEECSFRLVRMYHSLLFFR
jgi:hypothetical protein